DCYGTYRHPSAPRVDGCAGYLSGPIVVDISGVNVNAGGTYQVTYTVSDGVNTATATRTVTVQDTVKPVITLVGANPQVIECHGRSEERRVGNEGECGGGPKGQREVD